MKVKITIILLIVVVPLVCSLVYLRPFRNNDEQEFLQFGEIKISTTGLVRVKNDPAQYRIVPVEKYPAELRGVSLVDCRNQIYVARFFEPAGIGVEGFFDVCCQLKQEKLLVRFIDNSASLERIGSSNYITTCSYIYDSETARLFKCESKNIIKEVRVDVVADRLSGSQ